MPDSFSHIYENSGAFYNLSLTNEKITLSSFRVQYLEAVFDVKFSRSGGLGHMKSEPIGEDLSEAPKARSQYPLVRGER